MKSNTIHCNKFKKLICTVGILILYSILPLYAKNVCHYGLECPVEKIDAKTKTRYYLYRKHIVSTHGQDELHGAPVSVRVSKRMKVRRSRNHDVENIDSIISRNKTKIMELTTAPAIWFDGVIGNHLIMSGGTSNNSKELKIYNLANKKEIFSSELSDYVIIGNILIYYVFFREIKNKSDKFYKRCFQEIRVDYGLVLEQLHTFNLKVKTKKKLHEFRCAYNE